MLFRTPLWWAVLMIPALVTPILALVWISLGLLLGDGPWPTRGWDLTYALICATLGGVLGSVVGLRRRPWVRVSDAGIELAQRGTPVFIGWGNVASVSVHRWAPFAVLDVVPVSLHDVTPAASSGTLTPVRRLGDRAGFRVDVGGLLPGPRALRRALAQFRRPAQHL